MKRIVALFVLVVLILAAGIAGFIFGRADRCLRESHAAVAALDEELKKAAPQTLKTQENLAMWYNLSLRTGESAEDLSGAYENILRYSGDVMGKIEFTQEKLILPIYHGTREDSQYWGLLHDPGTDFPVGGKGNHCVLLGKAGLTDGSVFYDLTDLEKGETFTLHILDQSVVYLVERIRVTGKQPTDFEHDRERDLCTLVIRSGKQWVVIRGTAQTG